MAGYLVMNSILNRLNRFFIIIESYVYRFIECYVIVTGIVKGCDIFQKFLMGFISYIILN